MKLALFVTWGCVLVAVGYGGPTIPSSQQSIVIGAMVARFLTLTTGSN